MDWLTNVLWHNGKFLGIEWTMWKIVGWIGNVVFFSRFMVQWYATEKHKQVLVPASFWWLSLAGSLILLAYGLFYKKDSVIIFAYAFNWIPYVRNLVIHYRHEDAHILCSSCQSNCPPKSKYCFNCGTKLSDTKPQ
jgi:lipid-A-disaccharide synthase-like uncharacterized protein